MSDLGRNGNGITLPLRRVLVAVDDAAGSLRAARAAVAVAAATAARLRAVSVIQDGAFLRALGQASSAPKGEERLRSAADAVLRHISDIAARSDVPFETVVRAGDPGQQIVAEARQWQADLVVVGRCEHPGDSRLALGRVTQHVLELVDLPVLVVP
jgi:nucleotide-binding universal stress UspA family protein